MSIKLRPDIAREIHARASTSPETAAVLDVVSGYGLTMESVYEGAKDDELASYFSLVAPDAETAERVRQAIAACDGVEGAFVKAEGEPPE